MYPKVYETPVCVAGVLGVTVVCITFSTTVTGAIACLFSAYGVDMDALVSRRFSLRGRYLMLLPTKIELTAFFIYLSLIKINEYKNDCSVMEIEGISK